MRRILTGIDESVQPLPVLPTRHPRERRGSIFPGLGVMAQAQRVLDQEVHW